MTTFETNATFVDMQILLVLLSSLCFWSWSSLAWADLYQYIDAEGTIHLSNVPTNPRYSKIISESSTPAPKISGIRLTRAINRSSRRHHLHPALIRAVIKAESDFIPSAVSKAGAQGLMQLMPKTAQTLLVQDPFNPEENIRGGTKYLRYLLTQYNGSLTLALAAYNAGETAVNRYQSIPPYEETQRYVKKVLRYYRQYLHVYRTRSQKEIRPIIEANRRSSHPY